VSNGVSLTSVQSNLLHHASASRTDLLLACQYWANPAVQLPEEIGDNVYARFGRAFHKTMEVHLLEQVPDLYLIAKEYDADVKRLTDYYRRGSEIVDGILAKNGWDVLPRMVEVKVAYDPFVDKARVLEEKGTRSYVGRTATELPGTSDLVIPGIESWQSPVGKSIAVFDWKSGVTDYNAKTNAQLSSLALANSRLFNIPYAHVYILRLDDEFAEAYEATRNATQMEAHRTALRKAIRATSSQTPTMAHGTYCQYCPALEVCPSHRDPYLPVELMETATDPNQVAHIYPLLLAAEKKLHKTRERMSRYVEMNGPVDLDNGKRLRIT
jgi:hypothetical protein